MLTDLLNIISNPQVLWGDTPVLDAFVAPLVIWSALMGIYPIYLWFSRKRIENAFEHWLYTIAQMTIVFGGWLYFVSAAFEKQGFTVDSDSYKVLMWVWCMVTLGGFTVISKLSWNTAHRVYAVRFAGK